ncbi:MAG: hypothetical protein DRJ66_01485 [Thermoprotei archaeon]|mgnify:CR=1 FL=1|nr:MAG: hypothetical protein DRJ66_01485 [Thermoprotei archaeon]RLF18844.1 MAG: hypothetical protein DRZ82_07505 [Thermoprotei archaeon]
MERRVLIIGGSTFIGSWLLERLSEKREYRIVVLDETYPDVYTTRFHFIKGSLLERGKLRQALNNVDYVIHCLVHRDPLENNYDIFLKLNIKGTMNLVEEAIRQRINRLIFISTCDVYGIPTSLPVDENHPLRPITPYASSMVAAEALIMTLSAKDINWLILRAFDVYGPRQDQRWLVDVRRMCEDLILSGKIEVFGRGDTIRDLVYIEDLVEAVIELLERDEIEQAILNVANGEPIMLKDLVNLLIKISGIEAKIVFKEEFSKFMPSIYAEVRQLRSILPWFPRYSLQDGVSRTLKWVRMVLSKKSFLSY